MWQITLWIMCWKKYMDNVFHEQIGRYCIDMEEKLNGIIIYAPEDVEKNKRFITLCFENFKKKNIELKLVVLKDKNQADIRESMDIQKEKITFAINRSRNLRIAQQLESEGVRVFNNSRVTEICNDKWKTYQYASELGIPVMDTFHESICGGFIGIGYPMVIKSCAGHGGNEVFLVKNPQEKKAAIEKIPGDYIVQKFAETKGQDIRVYVLGEKIVMAMKRMALQGFKSNFSLGGTAQEYELNVEETDIIHKIVSDLKPDYVGIDFIYDGERLVLNEIEDAVGARMVYENTEIDMISMYVDYILECLVCKTMKYMVN